MKQIKLLSFADLHNCKDYADKCSKILDFVGEKALQIKPDFITISGDINNNAILNSDSHRLPEFKTKLDFLSGIAKIIMIYGTPSHDAAGSLEIFRNDKTIFIVRPEKPLIIDGCIFYCIPDYRVCDSDKKSHKEAGQDMNQYLFDLCKMYGDHRKVNVDLPAVILGHGNVRSTATENHEAIKRASIYLTEQILAETQANAILFGHIHQRINFATIPGCYLGGMAHNWKDLNYKPAIQEVIINKTGEAEFKSHEIPFIPRRIEISSFIINTVPTNEFNGDMVCLKKKKNEPGTKADLIEAGAHSDSKVVIIPEVKNIIRKKDMDKLEGYKELYKAYQIDATEEELAICDEIEKIEIKEGRLSVKKIIKPLSTHIKGLKQLFNGIGKEEIYIDWSKHNGILGLLAPGGMGKSAIVGCIPPHSACITQGNSLASMFADGGFIIQNWQVNNQVITTERLFKINNKKSETSYKVSIDGVKLDVASGSISSYDNYINFAFGSPRVCALTVLRSQFPNFSTWNKVAINPDIFTMPNAEFKTIVAELTNCSKEFAYLYCKNNLDQKTVELKSIETTINGIKDNIGNKKEIEETIIKLKELLKELENDLLINNSILLQKKSEIDILNTEFLESEKARSAMILYDSQLETNNIKLSELKALINRRPIITEEQIKGNIFKIENQKAKQEEAEKRNNELQKKHTEVLISYNTELSAFNKLKKEHEEKERVIINLMNERNSELKNQYTQRLITYNNEYKEYRKKQYEFDIQKANIDKELNQIVQHKESLLKEIKDAESKIEFYNKPCEYCGKIASSSKTHIETLNNSIVLSMGEIDKADEKIYFKTNKLQFFVFDKAEPKEPIEPTYEKQSDLKELQDLSFNAIEPTMPIEPEYEQIDKTIQITLDIENKKLSDYQLTIEKIKNAELEYSKIAAENEEINIKHFAESCKVKINLSSSLHEKKKEILNTETRGEEIAGKISNEKANIKSCSDKITDIDEANAKLLKLEGNLEASKKEYLKWDRLSAAWHRDGIPAMILENIAPTIDQGINDLLQVYYPKLMIQTETISKYANKKEFYENYHIDIINNDTGNIQPFNSLSGEERDFIAAAFREICRNIYEGNSNIIYQLGIDDEPDAHVSEERLQDFWNMKRQLDEGKERLRICISHSPLVKTIFDNSIDLMSI